MMGCLNFGEFDLGLDYLYLILIFGCVHKKLKLHVI